MTLIPGRAPVTTAHQTRYDTIDLLRGISIIAVVLLHTWIRFHYGEPPVAPKLWPWAEHLLLHNGGNGVTVFFSISGFLIATTAMRRFGLLGGMQVPAFYRIRFARIAPLVLTVIAVLSALHLAHVTGFVINAKKGETLGGAIGAALTFRINWYEAVHGYLPANWDVMWSLSVEEMFYLFFPLVCWLVLRRGWGMWVFVAGLVGLVAWGPHVRMAGTGNDIWNEYNYWNGMSLIAPGVLTALLLRWVSARPAIDRKVLLGLEWLGGLSIALIFIWPRWHWIKPGMRALGKSGTDDLLLAVGTCLVMFASVLLGQRGCRVLAPVRWFGRHSYEVYLTHEFVVIAGTELYFWCHKGPVDVWFAGILLLTAPLGWVVAKSISEPMNKWLRGTRETLAPTVASH